MRSGKKQWAENQTGINIRAVIVGSVVMIGACVSNLGSSDFRLNDQGEAENKTVCPSA